ncbi:MAG: hypothetical protein Q7T69_13950 [Rhodoferax sp.]|nr:hypothetical protein [Rhodoferax sp.]
MATAETKPVVTASAPTASAAAPKVAVKPKAKTKAKAKPAVKTVAAKAPVATTKAVVAKPATKTPAKPVVASPVAAKPVKAKKVKMVRDSFTMPKPEYAVLDVLKLRAGKLAMPIKKTELIRAGIKALAALPDAAFLAALRAVPNLKTGRPAKN